MAQAYRSLTALRDLDQIWDYIARNSVAAADRLIEKVHAKCEMLARQPLLGESREELGPGVRCSPVGTYLIFYRPFEDGIEVVRVLHGARDIKTQF